MKYSCIFSLIKIKRPFQQILLMRTLLLQKLEISRYKVEALHAHSYWDDLDSVMIKCIFFYISGFNINMHRNRAQYKRNVQAVVTTPLKTSFTPLLVQSPLLVLPTSVLESQEVLRRDRRIRIDLLLLKGLRVTIYLFFA